MPRAETKTDAKATTSRPTVMANTVTQSVPIPAVPEPTQDQIRVRAYEIYLARGAGPGRAAEDWEQAKRELRARAASTSPATPARRA